MICFLSFVFMFIVSIALYWEPLGAQIACTTTKIDCIMWFPVPENSRTMEKILYCGRGVYI